MMKSWTALDGGGGVNKLKTRQLYTREKIENKRTSGKKVRLYSILFFFPLKRKEK